METLWLDIKYGIRMLAKQPGVTAMAVLTLALGIGANTTIFSLLYNALLRPLPVADRSTLCVVRSSNLTQSLPRSPVSMPDFLDWREQNQVFSGMTLATGKSYNLAGGSNPVHVAAQSVSSEYFQVLGVRPALGRSFVREEEQPGKGKVAVLSYSLWQQSFGGDPDILGKVIRLDGEPFEVIGVMPQGFWFPDRGVQLWTPLSLDWSANPRNRRIYWTLARLKPGVSRSQAQIALNVIAKRLADEHPDTNENWTVRVTDLLDLQAGDKLAVIFLAGAVIFVLLIACANVANLMLARSAVRQREFAVRMALGAGRLRLIQQLLTESFLLALLGGGLGFLLAGEGVRGLEWANQGTSPLLENIPVDWQVFAFTLLLSSLSAVLFGLFPALRSSNPNLNETLKETSRSLADTGRLRLLRFAIVAEMCLAFILLHAASVLLVALYTLRTVDRGYRTRNVLTFSVALPLRVYPESHQVTHFYRELLDRIQSLPGVETASAVSQLPATGGSLTPMQPIDIENRVIPARQARPMAILQVVSPEYFDAFQIPLKKGRSLSPQDASQAPRVALVSEAFEQRYFPNQSALGQRVRLGSDPSDRSWITIVGVVSDVSNDDIDQPPLPVVYLPHMQYPLRTMSLAISTSSRPLDVAPAVRQQVHSLDREIPIFDVKTMDQVVYEDLAGTHVFVGSLVAFAVIALLLAAVGIYGVMSFSVNQRAHEIGIRLALGATAAEIKGWILRQASRLALSGVAIGLIGAVAVARILSSVVSGTQANNLLYLPAVGLFLLAVALAACWVPARRAARVDPIVALRYE